MVRHGRRVTAVALATVFLGVGSADAFGTHACPHHDPLAAHSGQVPAAHSDQVPALQAGSVHSVSAHSPSLHDSEPSHGEGEAHGPCTCVGECSGSSDGVVTGTKGHPRWVPVPDSPEFGGTPYDYLPAVRSAYLLPLANAPPV